MKTVTYPGHDDYAMWDAAYVLGSLSSRERREFEAHMTDCTLCGNAVGELSGLLDRDELAAVDDRSGAEPLLPDELLPSLLGHTRMATWAANPGHTATPAGSTSTRVDQIASVQVVSADGQVLLERSL